MIDEVTPAPAKTPSPVAERSSMLRLWLAVRDWADPRDFIADLGDKSRRQVLNAVARDVNVDPQGRPGQWSLKNEVRRRITASRPPEVLVQSAQEAGNDPVAAAIRVMLDPDKPRDWLAHHGNKSLAALQAVLGWLPDTVTTPGVADVAGLRREVGALLAARQRTTDVRRLSKQTAGQQPLVRDIQHLLLSAPASAPDGDPPVAFAWGIGGSGKSTLVAEIEKIAHSRTPPFVVVHLDFDRATLNPMVDGALDLAFLDQVGAADSERGSAARTARQELEQSLGRQKLSDYAAVAWVGSASRTRRGARAKTRLVKSSKSNLESVTAELRSAVAGTMTPFASVGSPLLLILDSVEAVEAIGLHAMRQLERWAATTGALAGQPDTRILAAGRRARTSRETGIAWFERWMGIIRDFQIDQLSDSDRERVLARRGMHDVQMRSFAAKTIPGNPLLLRFTAEAWVKESSDRQQILTAAGRRYLDERLVRHMQDPAARAYVTPALAIPRLTQSVIGKILLPVVEPQRKASIKRTRQIYNAFRGATWLTSERRNGHELVLRPEVRKFSLELAQHIPESAELLSRVHLVAATWHESRKSSEDRAFAFYHRAMSGAVNIPSSGRSRRSFTRILGDAVADLPEPVRQALIARSASAIGPDELSQEDDLGDHLSLESVGSSATHPYSTLSDQEWAVFFEGSGSRDGLAWQLVEADNPGEALSLYRNRPTKGQDSLPPTPILQALVETGDPIENLSTWIEAELTASLGGRPKIDRPPERLYWIVRALCMAVPESTPPIIRNLVIDAILNTLPGSDKAYRTQYMDLIDIAMIYFLSQPSSVQEIARITDRVDNSRLTHRVALSRLLRRLPFGEVSTTNEQLVVRQLGEWIVERDTWDGDSVAAYVSYKDRLAKLPEERLSVIEKALSVYENEPVRLKVRGLRREDAIQLLRGLTPEIHRPLRHALVEAWQTFTPQMTTTSPQEVVRHVIEDTRQSMSVRPIEFEGREFWRLIKNEPAVWLGAFISFADRARVLPQLTDAILRAAEDVPEAPLQKLVHVARVFRGWDRALTDGTGSHFTNRSAWKLEP